MPPPPKLRGGLGGVGIVEVLRQGQAEGLTQAQRHIRVAGEVKVQLQGVGDGANPGQAHTQPVPGGKGPVCRCPQGVRQQHLFRQAEAKPHRPCGDLRNRLPPVRQQRAKVPVPHNGSLEQLGKKGRVQRQPGKIPLRRNGPPVYIGQV